MTEAVTILSPGATGEPLPPMEIQGRDLGEAPLGTLPATGVPLKPGNLAQALVVEVPPSNSDLDATVNSLEEDPGTQGPSTIDAPMPVGPDGPLAKRSRSKAASTLEVVLQPVVVAVPAEAPPTPPPPAFSPEPQPAWTPPLTPTPVEPWPPMGLPPVSERRVLFGRYRLERELGRGGMGVVWLVHDTVLDMPMALKLVPEAVATSAHHLEGLRKEVLRGMALTHPAMVRIYSFERDEHCAAILMEYVEGESLADLQAHQTQGCFEPIQLRLWLEQLCSTLDYAHREAHIAHRDLKPRNLMITREGRLKVADFGIASSLSETLQGISMRTDSSGTPPYMSPQQTMGERPTVADDIYSVGATLYDLLTSRPPFYRGNIIAQVQHETAPSMNARRAELGVTERPPIPAQWERVVAACLAKDPEERPPSGAALIQLLDTAPHALVPYVKRDPIPLESLRLNPTTQHVVLRPHASPLHDEASAASTSTVEVFPEYARKVKVLPPESAIGGFFSELLEGMMTWFWRGVYAAFGLAIAAAILYLVHEWQKRQPADVTIVVQMSPAESPPSPVVQSPFNPLGAPRLEPATGPQPGQMHYNALPPGMHPPPPPPPPPPMGRPR